MKFRSLIPVLCLAQIAGAQLVMNPQRRTLVGKWVRTDWAQVPQSALAAHEAAGVGFPEGNCVFSTVLKPSDKRPIRYEQVSELRRHADGSCEMDFDAGDPVPLPGGPDPADGGSGPGKGGGSGGITAGYKDPIYLAVTELWVGQNFTYDGNCIYNQSAWPGSWERTTTGWSIVGYQFSAGVSNLCPQCPQHPGYMGPAYAQATNGTFINTTFCFLLTGKSGPPTFTDYSNVSDYGLPDGSTYWQFSSTASGGCSLLLSSFYTFT